MSLRIVLILTLTLLWSSSFVEINEGNFNKKPGEIKLKSSINIYEQLRSDGVALPAMETFNKAYAGYLKLREKKSIGKEILTIIDFTLSSNKKRLWVIDLKDKKVLFNSLVAHGKNSGGEYARKFSNISQSYQSSLGFYVTGKTYYGKHGLSLYLNGMEKGINDNARQRYIVMHGADYVSQNFIRKYGRLGRSYGCPAVSMKLYRDIIKKIKDKSCLFIYYPAKDYETNSLLIRNHQNS